MSGFGSPGHPQPGGAAGDRHRGDGRRIPLAVELANGESPSRWRDFLLALRQHGLPRLEFVVPDDHAGLKPATLEVLPKQLGSAATCIS